MGNIAVNANNPSVEGAGELPYCIGRSISKSLPDAPINLVVDCFTLSIVSKYASALSSPSLPMSVPTIATTIVNAKTFFFNASTSFLLRLLLSLHFFKASNESFLWQSQSHFIKHQPAPHTMQHFCDVSRRFCHGFFAQVRQAGVKAFMQHRIQNIYGGLITGYKNPFLRSVRRVNASTTTILQVFHHLQVPPPAP